MSTQIQSLQINLEVEKPQENILKELGYYSFQERVFDLSKTIKHALNEEYSKVIGANVYEGLAKHYSGKSPNQNHIIFNGAYKLAPFNLYMGNIPLSNQLEIKEKYEYLLSNPFLNQKFELVILAPLNNFAEENNIKAIDPIVFAYFTEGDYNQRNYLIALSQWI